MTSLQDIKKRFEITRAFSKTLCEPLETEDYCMQAHPLASPVNWHIAHVTWFFETFLLQPFSKDYKIYHDQFTLLFNSYYNHIGKRIMQKDRHKLSRPTVKEIWKFRAYVEEHMDTLFASGVEEQEVIRRTSIGINHEQQHQELILTDFKNYLAEHYLQPTYKEQEYEKRTAPESTWVTFEGGVVDIGHTGDEFCYDNEQPAHKQYLQPYKLQNRLVTNKEFIEFMEADGYTSHQYWLSDGWMWVQEQQLSHPKYWEKKDGKWHVMTLSGLKELDLDEPVCHVSFFEADAYAKWKGCRLPTEFEWEHAASKYENTIESGNFADDGVHHPRPSTQDAEMKQLFGDVWEWTVSAYGPYPGYYPEEGAIGEYNGKFMNNTRVLKGGSCATSRSHIRRTYRNFWSPDTRWQFTGIRLATEVGTDDN